uniref:Transposase n=1 Tax=Heligmosomoides polygyrus TaxID=6339 RepID=A0A183GV93_HELPZ
LAFHRRRVRLQTSCHPCRIESFRTRVTDVVHQESGYKRRVTDVGKWVSAFRRRGVSGVWVSGFRTHAMGATTWETGKRWTSNGGPLNGDPVRDGEPVMRRPIKGDQCKWDQ